MGKGLVTMTVKYPILEQDRDKWMFIIETESKLGYHLEAIDIENKEYMGWDIEGRPIEFYLDKNEIKVRYLSNETKWEDLKEAILNYAKFAKPKIPFIDSGQYNNLGDLFRAVENHITFKQKKKGSLEF